jgi:spore coat protein U-like protein
MNNRKIATLSVFCFLLIGQIGISYAYCSIGLQDIFFGTYDASSAIPDTTIAELVMNCRTATTVTIEISPGQHSKNTVQRKMRHTQKADVLNYNLFHDQSMSQIWSNGIGGSPLVQRVDGRHQIMIYGQIYPHQDVWVGEYEDTVRLTIMP